MFTKPMVISYLQDLKAKTPQEFFIVSTKLSKQKAAKAFISQKAELEFDRLTLPNNKSEINLNF